MIMSIKLVAIDLDGTLLNDNKQLTEENIAAINAASKMGVNIVLCTGRPITGIQRYLAQLELQNEREYAITYNGGLAQTINGEILIKHTLSFQDYLLPKPSVAKWAFISMWMARTIFTLPTKISARTRLEKVS